MRMLGLMLLLSFSISAFAEVRPMGVKDRLRILLWTEGLTKELTQKGRPIRHRKPLPPELEIPLLAF